MAEICNITGDESPLRRIKERAWNGGRPMSAQIEITYVCNLDCSFCYNVVDKEGDVVQEMRSEIEEKK